ncbi:MAG: PAS domain S-box protein [Deltaproteobacteria bacterium]|nr:PAS domain S-box protein [Deltaproteobacteria bacterium]
MRLALAAVVATVVAAWGERRHAVRIAQLREWVRRVGAGERVSPPLREGAPDAVDDLGADLGTMAEALGDGLMRLENERDRLEAILAAMVEGVIVIDRSGTILRASARVAETFGTAAGRALVGLRLWDLSRDVEFNTVVREALASQRPAVREVELRGAVQLHLEVAVGPTADGSAWVLVLHDVTETKRLERVRTDFVANVSHELRTPLTAIKGFAETLLSSGFADRERALHFVSIIDRQAGRLSRIIDDLLILSDLELGKMRVQRRAVELEPIVREVVELLGEPARRGGVALAIDLSPELRVDGDPDRLTQVASNLLDNAIKYTPPGGRVRIAGRALEDGSAVELSVEDSGVGIPAEDLPRLAERFYRVDKARVRERGGTGLGLSIVKHIVQAHGGSLRFDSRVGTGTTVTVTLPAAADG